VVCQQPRWC